VSSLKVFNMPLYSKEKIYSVPVQMKAGSLTCVFGSKQDMTGLATDLGITAIADATQIPGVGVFTGANSPRLPRGSKMIGSKKKSSFCDPSVAGTKDDVDIKYPKSRTRTIHTPTDASLVVSVFVEIDAVERAWNMSKTQYTLINGDFTELGISLCDKNNAPDYVWGCEAPFPARAKKYNPTGVEGGDVYVTFCSKLKEDSLVNWAKLTDSITVKKYFGGEV
jgi:hypothetical protein